MMITDYLRKIISWEDYNRAYPSEIPFREILNFKQESKANGLSLEEGFRRLYAQVYEKTTMTDSGGYPKYKLKRKPSYDLHSN